VPLATALAVFVAIGVIHWVFCRGAWRHGTDAGEPRVRAWLCAAIVAGFAILAPSLIAGWWGTRFQMAVVRPAFRVVGILPTPKLEVGSIRIDLPYREPGIGVPQTGSPHLTIRAIAHAYRSDLHPAEPIDIAVYSRDALLRSYDRYAPGKYIAADLGTALEDPAIAAGPLTLRFDFADTRRFRSIARYLPDHPDVVFALVVRSPDVGFDELDAVLDRFIAERVGPSAGTRKVAEGG